MGRRRLCRARQIPCRSLRPQVIRRRCCSDGERLLPTGLSRWRAGHAVNRKSGTAFRAAAAAEFTWSGRKSRPVKVIVGIPSAEQLMLNITPCSPRSTTSVTRTSIGEVASHTSASTMFSDATTSWPNSVRMPAMNSRIARSGSVKRMRAIGCLISTNSCYGHRTAYGLRMRKDVCGSGARRGRARCSHR